MVKRSPSKHIGGFMAADLSGRRQLGLHCEKTSSQDASFTVKILNLL